MKRIWFCGCLWALAVGLAGCYAEFKLKGEMPASRLVLHAFVTADSLVVSEVSNSWVVGEAVAPVALPGARVALSLNGEFKEWLQWRIPPVAFDSLRGKGRYYSTCRPQEGDRVELKVEADGFGPACAHDRIPEKVKVEEVRLSRASGTSGYEMLKMYITFQDQPDKRNYYGLKVYRSYYDKLTGSLAPYGGTENVVLDYSEEPLFSRTGTIFDDLFTSESYVQGLLYPFSDEKIDGQRYTLKVSSFLDFKFDESATYQLLYTVVLYSFSEDYYRYILSLTRQGTHSLSDYGLADPALVYHNVEGGIGIVGTYRIDTCSFEPALWLRGAHS